jgi:hypothetical protein
MGAPASALRSEAASGANLASIVYADIADENLTAEQRAEKKLPLKNTINVLLVAVCTQIGTLKRMLEMGGEAEAEINKARFRYWRGILAVVAVDDVIKRDVGVIKRVAAPDVTPPPPTANNEILNDESVRFLTRVGDRFLPFAPEYEGTSQYNMKCELSQN